MPTEIRISKHNAIYQASVQLEELDYTKLYRAYSGIRKSQIEPRVLFKVLVCAYMKGVYSSRKIEELCRENLVFRWLLEDQKTPDHCTIARFRGNRNLQEAFEDLFFQYVKKLEDKGYTEHSEVFVDGTKIESKANRYTLSARSMPYTDRPVPNHSATAMRPFLEQHLYVYEQSAFPVH